MKFAQKTLTHFKIPKMFGLRAHSIEGVAGLGCVWRGGMMVGISLRLPGAIIV